MIDYNKFACFILTHGRPTNVKTYQLLRKRGYKGKIYLIVDDEDKTLEAYKKNFKDEVIVFSKKEIDKTTDCGDNFHNFKTVLYARNACFPIATKLGLDYFLELDDDYTSVESRFNKQNVFAYENIKDINNLIINMLEFLEATPTTTISFAQGGDFIGGKNGTYGKAVKLGRKSMNSFFCKTNRPFLFLGTLNDDVNTFTTWGKSGQLFFMYNHILINQAPTQQQAGGLTDIYLQYGTYVKSMYSVMYNPSFVKLMMMGNKFMRIHHQVNKEQAYPKILDQKYKKG